MVVCDRCEIVALLGGEGEGGREGGKAGEERGKGGAYALESITSGLAAEVLVRVDFER